MKEVGTTSWYSPNTESTNISLFAGLPGGYRMGIGNYEGIGSVGIWWSSTEYYQNRAGFRYLFNSNGITSRDVSTKEGGFSVRCLRD
jgi:uncharacterized protein (TIGR02145 family)